MEDYKRFIQDKFAKMKSTASDLISPRSDDKESVSIELDMYDELQKLAYAQGTSVQALVNELIREHLKLTSKKPTQITADKKEENPLLYLDAICKFED